MRIWIGNLNYNTDAIGLRDWFKENGFVATEIKVITNRDTGHSKGFAFAEVEDEKVIDAMNGQKLEGRAVIVSVANPLSTTRGMTPSRHKPQRDNRYGVDD